MAADWHLHLVEPRIDEATLRCFFHNHSGQGIEDLTYRGPEAPAVGICRHRREIAGVDAVEVGSKHWQHPWWTGKASEDLPEPIGEIINAFEDFKPVTPELVEKIRSCYELPATKMFPMESIEQYRNRVLAFLERSMGRKIFPVGW